MRALLSPRRLALLGGPLGGLLVLAALAGLAEAGPGGRGPGLLPLDLLAPPEAFGSKSGFGRGLEQALQPWRPDPDTTAADTSEAARRAALEAEASAEASPARQDSLRQLLAGPQSLARALGPRPLSSEILADTTDSLRRARVYFPTPRRDGFGAALAPRRVPRLQGGLGPYWRREVALDTTGLAYTIRETVGGADVREPAALGLQAFLAAQREAALADGFRTLADARAVRRGPRRSGFGVTVDIPGGNQSAFRTLFGKNEVDLRVSGTSNIDLGMGYNTNELQQAISGVGGTLAPDFGQQLNLNVAGTIGDKLRINVNYDTQSQFDFENQVSLVYTGYEDDIVKRIEAGNVFLQTPSELIRGGQRLFGLRTDLQFGPLGVTAVASQQDAESREVVITGGSQATPFALAPFQYENNAHFFLGYAFYAWWDRGHRDPSNAATPPGLAQLTGIEVWRQDAQAGTTTQSTDEAVFAIALVDLAEPPDVLAGAPAYLAARGPEAPLPAPALHRYTAADLDDLRVRSDAFDIAARFGLGEPDYEKSRFRKLVEGRDYRLDPYLGWISLASPLGDNDALAVAYQYRTLSGQVVTVGDFGTASQDGSQTGRRTLLKLLRDKLPTPQDAAWGLTMRNVYRVGGRQLNPSTFRADLTYEPSGSTPQTQLPGVTVGQGQTLLQMVGLDRTNQNGLVPTPDQLFDFRPGYTIDAENGRIIFPTREPFGAALQGLLQNGQTVSGTAVDVTIQGGTYADIAGDVVFPALYTLKPEQFSRQFPKARNYAIRGEFRGTSQSVYNVGFNLVPGSVRVTSGGQVLLENSDYVVNYSSGTVEIRNPVYLAAGQQVRVQVEQNRFVSVGSKTLLGLRADYRVNERIGLGATWMQLGERPLVDKFRIGEEAIQNTIMGLDGRLVAEPRWLTRALDALPLIQTSAPSRIELRGEVAQLRPGSPETLAFRDVRRTLRADGFDLPDDELRGISFLDDFEGSENVNSELFDGPGWRISSGPTGAGPAGLIPDASATDVTDPRLRNNWRGLFAWYTLDDATYRGRNVLTREAPLTPATRRIGLQELFPERQFAPQELQSPLRTLDLYFDPSRRGPYNYNADLETAYAANPRAAWGGMTRALSAAYADFDGRNSVEFVEFLVAPLGGRSGDEPLTPGAALFLDLGDVSEDVLPNRVLNTEDGLTDGGTRQDLDLWGRRPGGQFNNTIDTFPSGRTEDVGLNGLPSDRRNTAGEPYDYDEREHFAAFLARLTPGTPEYNRAQLDPSGDDYRHFLESHFNDPALYPGGASVQERFANYYPASELNSVRGYAEVRGALGTLERERGAAGLSQQPNTEDVNGNFTLDTVESFYRYRIPLTPDSLRQSPFFQNEIQTSGETWYLMRIPVRTEFRQAVGGIQDLSRVQMARVWTTGHERPATLRFASFKLVGSQWQKSERVGIEDDGLAEVRPGPDGALRRAAARPATAGEPRLFIESINNEESPQRYAIPRGALVNTARDIGGVARPVTERALIFRAEGLGPGQSRAIFKPYTTTRLDLTRYTNLRMFVHGEGFERRDSVRVVVRLGSNETEDYYEYEQPVYPFDSNRLAEVPARARPDSLWQTNVRVGGETLDLNSVNVVLAELNRVKLARDQAGAPLGVPFSDNRTPTGAPPGARIRVRGNPSIQAVNTVVLGVRNGSAAGAPLDDVQLWFNELRVSGYDEGGGASGFLTANVALADVAQVQARYAFTQDGFGELGGGLGGRAFADQGGFTLTSQINAHKLLPERFGWRVPVSVSIVENQTTPRYAPNRGDIRLSELAEAAAGGPEGRIEADRIVREAQTATSQRTLRVPIQKTGSRSPWLRYTLDGLAATYTNTQQRTRTPSSEFANQDAWRTDLAYRLTVPRPRTVRPLWFADDVPVVGGLAGLRLNLLPQQVRFSADAGRTLGDTRERPRLLAGAPPETDEALGFLYPRRRTHAFGHGRQVDLQYNPFSFLQLAYGSSVAQRLDEAGVDETFQLYVRRPDGTLARTYGISRDSARAAGSVVWQDFGVGSAEEFGRLQVYGGSQLTPRPLGTVLGDVFSGERGVLTDRYNQTLTGSLRVSLDRHRWLAWLRPQPLSYTSQYAWDYVPVTARPDLALAGVGTNVQLQTGLQARPREFWRLFPFYRRLEEADRLSRLPAGRAPVAADGPAPARPGALSPRQLSRRVFLALTGVDDATVTYRGSLRNSAGGVEGGAFSLLAGLLGDAPPLGYRLGLDRRLPLGSRLGEDVGALQFRDLLGDQHDLSARTSLQPFPSLRVGLTWTTGWSRNDLFPLAFDPATGGLAEQGAIRRGAGESSVFGFGGSYARLLERQLGRLDRDLAGPPGPDGEVASDFRSRLGVTEDFQRTFARGAGRFGPEALYALPLPSWDVNFSGLSAWPLLRGLTQQVTLRHSYFASSRADYASVDNFAPTPLVVSRGGQTATLRAPVPDVLPSTTTVNERFQPLLGVAVAWRGGFQTDLTWNRSNLHTLQAASATLTEKNIQDVQLQVSYSKTGMRFLGRRLNNALRFTLTGSVSDDQSFNYFVGADLDRLLLGQAPQPVTPTGFRRLSAAPRLSYQVSNQVSMDLFLRYDKTSGVGSQISPNSSLDGGVSVRIAFSN